VSTLVYRFEEIGPRPLRPEVYELDGISRASVEAHYKLYEGYVGKRNEILRRLADADLAVANQVYSEFRALKVDLSFENTKLEDILGFVRDFSGLNILLDAQVRDRVDSDKTVTIKVRDLTVKDTLTQLLTPLGLDYVVTGDNVVLLTDPQKAALGVDARRRATESGGNVSCAPRKPLESKVIVAAAESGVVVISVGIDDGVMIGDEFAIIRGGEIIAKIEIDRVDRKWASGKIQQRSRDPKVGDDVSNAGLLRPQVREVPVEQDADRQSLDNLRRIRAKMGIR